MGFSGGSVVKSSSANAGNTGDTGDAGSIPGLGRSPGGGNGNPFQYSWLENAMDRGAWWVPDPDHSIYIWSNSLSVRVRNSRRTASQGWFYSKAFPGNDS